MESVIARPRMNTNTALKDLVKSFALTLVLTAFEEINEPDIPPLENMAVPIPMSN